MTTTLLGAADRATVLSLQSLFDVLQLAASAQRAPQGTIARDLDMAVSPVRGAQTDSPRAPARVERHFHVGGVTGSWQKNNS
ncbi:MAG: hypothetical protein NVS2B9_12200 [Myxococcales bacterium]